ncbi:MAG: nucleotide pyrophosphohydrolase [Thermogutta sp.]|nr:nucleotide pyrophosphohydrolase [Thermogutta sp.]
MTANPRSDDSTTLADLRRWVEEFVSARDWHRFHTPKNLAMALAIEAAELMEHFQWLTPEQSRQVATRPDRRDAAAEELADVLCYALALANELGIDVASAVFRKMEKNAVKYPVERYRGYFGPDDPAMPAES